jgi:hypothetical protein
MKSSIQVFSIVVILICFFSITASAQLKISTGNGDWNTAGTWNPSGVPAATDSVLINSTDSVSLAAAGTCLNLTLQGNAKLALNAAALSIPGSSWNFDVASTVYYNGTTTITTGPTFGNLVYMSPSGGPGANTTLNIAGDLTVTTATLRGIGATSGTNTINVAGNVFLTGAAARISAVNNSAATSASCAWYIGGNVSLTGNAAGNRIILFESAGPHTGSAVYNIDGNLSIGTSCQIDLRSSTSATASSTGTINIKGNISNSGDIRSNTGNAGNLTINLNGTSAQQWTGAFPIAFSANQSCNLQINNSAGVTLNNNVAINTNDTLNVLGGGLLNLGSYVVSGTGPFNLNAGATIMTAHYGGLDSNITTTGTKTLSTSANYTFNGSSGQVTGTLLPSTVNNLSIDNGSGVQLTSGTTVNGTLALSSGIVTTGANTLAIGAAGNVSRTGGYVIGTLQKHVETGSPVPLTLELGTASGYSPVDLSFNNVSIAGNFSGSIVPGDHPNLAVSGIDTANSANEYWSFATDATIDTYNGTLHFDPEDLDAYADPNNFVARAYNGSTWSPITVGIRTVNSTEISGPISSSGIIALGDIATVKITASAGPNGTIFPAGEVSVDYGASQSFMITPYPGYHVDSVLVDEVKVDSTTSYTFINTIANHTIRAVFATTQYQITASAGPNGSINPSGSVVVDSSGTQVFAITPDANYHVDSLLVDEAKVDSTLSYTFINVTANHTIRAVFAIDQFAITASAGLGGTITPSGTVVVEYGGTQAFAISPNVHYQIDSVSVDGAKVDSTTSYTFVNITIPHTIRVTFAAIIMSIRSNGTGGGDWNTASTWIGGIIPLSVDTVEIVGGDSISLAAAGSCSVLALQANAKLALNASGLSVPGAAWNFDVTSTVYYNGATTVGTGPTYGNLVYATASNGGPAANSTLNVTGNLIVTTNTLRGISATSGTNTINVAGNIVIGPGTSARISAVNSSNPTSASCTWNIGGNVSLTGDNAGNRIIVEESAGPHTGSAIININGNLSIDTLSQLQYRSSTNGVTGTTPGIVNVRGNVTVKGLISSATGGTGFNHQFNLIGTNVQQYTGNFPGPLPTGQTITMNIGNSAGVTLNNNVNVNMGISINILSGALLNLGTNTATGVGLFYLNSGATLSTGSTNGINGNFVFMGPSLSKGANYIYNGSTAQVTGTLLPDTVNKLTIDNNYGVAMSASTTVNDTLNLKTGLLKLGDASVTSSAIIRSFESNYVVTNGLGLLTNPLIGSTETLMPIGVNESYAPVWITNIGTANSFSVRVQSDTIPPPSGGRVNAKWIINYGGVAGGSNCTLKFGWTDTLEDAAFKANPLASAGIFRFGTDTVEAGTGLYIRQLDTLLYWIERGGFTTLGTFAVGQFGTITSVKDNKNEQVPLEFMLSQNYPNPFNPTTTIEFTVPNNGIAKLTIYNLLGQKVATLFNGEAKAGTVQRVIFNASNLSSGVYFSRLDYGSQKMVRRLLLMK